ncbi:Matrixin [Planctomycetes bacterium Poly30]|uniref:Matrixin n=2 Tax=Saltatorellus ferox TaxID=2528018 RepID=A0A518ETY3_9BACT|nr:Matrixin [Planctomycetes bacterium Poly30]
MAFAVYGDFLDLTLRDFRILNTFAGVRANDNVTPDPDFPGSLGADLAIRKAVAEWGSRPHGSGLTDPSQDQLGSGQSNFEAFYAGDALLAGGQNQNVISVIAGGGGIAFTDLPIGDGWRIRFFENARDWNDGPGDPEGGIDRFDIQGVMTHEFGHALGLDHSLVPGATMENNGSPDFGVHLRSIEADDIAGVQFIYGPVSPFKPVLETYEFIGPGRIRITGSNFHGQDNEIWFTPEAPTLPMTDPTILVGGLASSQGGTVLELDIPAAAGPGSVAVRVPGSTSEALSNVFPFDPFLEPWAPPMAYGQPGVTSAGTTPTIGWSGLPSASIPSFHIEVEGGANAAFALLIEGTSRSAVVTSYGTLLVGGQVRRRLILPLSGGAGTNLAPIVPAGLIGDRSYYQVWVPDGGSVSGGVFTDALEVVVSR